ncbi:uncharacterized protein LOC109724400 isoform X1 [Ananas comosus]|uniref:Uncharacterized protein LOC109724400 isoform X1 n=1 Tax=Ananas comosus TaxID=4615 RepID=A0A199VB54_ANACO|nr:uncharacterized protein LOC109724400 isoform X1 [Ananas comosus]OAY74314.1 hypothetical protein ACMD2_01459 [Ananas comosus]
MATRRAASLYGLLLRRPPPPPTAAAAASAAPFHSRDFEAFSYGMWRHYSNCKPASPIKLNSFRSAIYPFSTSARSEVGESKISIGPKTKELEKDDEDANVVYRGPISSTIKKVKLLSLSTCCLSVSLGPVITFMTSPGMNVILKGAVASTVIFLSASTTAALHWFVSPYIHKLRWRPGSDSFEVVMMSWLATPISKTIKFADVVPPATNRPFVTFKADGSFYFVDVEHFHNKALLARLTPDNRAHQSAFKNL